MKLIMSLFSGIGLLDIAFKEQGFCVVSAGDIILGQHHDIRKFHAPAGKFDGVIGGSPCQKFSKANRTNRNPIEGMEMVHEFIRVVTEAQPSWFLLENVPEVPDIHISGYKVQVIHLNAKNCGSSQNRNRKFQFGSKEGRVLVIKREQSPISVTRCVTASEGRKGNRRSFTDFCELQGLPRNFDLPDFNKSSKYKAVGNGVNLHTARVIASAVQYSESEDHSHLRLCKCGCGSELTGKQLHASATCRKRMQSKRERAGHNHTM
jgi:DNA (cytosine-5)-methyltransferase 1